jgi:hypothetical protein
MSVFVVEGGLIVRARHIAARVPNLNRSEGSWEPAHPAYFEFGLNEACFGATFSYHAAPSHFYSGVY